MGGYLSSKKDSKGVGGESRRDSHTGSSPSPATEEDYKKSKYSVVYTDRTINSSDLPRDLAHVFVLRRTGSMYMDEDGQYAHEFYIEKKVKNKKGVVRWKMEKISNTLLIPQGEVRHPYPRLHVDFPLVLLEANAMLVPRLKAN